MAFEDPMEGVTFQHSNRKFRLDFRDTPSMTLQDGLLAVNIDPDRVRVIVGGKTVSDKSILLETLVHPAGRSRTLMIFPNPGYSLPDAPQPVAPDAASGVQPEVSVVEMAVSIQLGCPTVAPARTFAIRDGQSRVSVEVHGDDKTIAELSGVLASSLRSANFQLINKGHVYSTTDQTPLSTLPSREFMLRRTAMFWDREEMRLAMEEDLKRLNELVAVVPKVKKAALLDPNASALRLRDIRIELDRIQFNADLFSDRLSDEILQDIHRQMSTLLKSPNLQFY